MLFSPDARTSLGAQETFRCALRLAPITLASRLKQHLAGWLREQGHEVIDLGTTRPNRWTTPTTRTPWVAPFSTAAPSAASSSAAAASAPSIAANKLPGIRAGLCHDTYSAAQGVLHDDINVLVLGARVIGPALAESLVTAFLAARFTGAERHVRRLDEGQGARDRGG